MNLLDQLGSVRLIFLDTAPVIYFVENNPAFAPKLQPVFTRLDDDSLSAVVSPITLAECLVLPYTLSNSELVGIFLNLMVNHPSILFFPIDESTAEKAAELRAHYHLSLTDAFQIAIAIQANCDAFLTNDMDLMRVTEIPIIVVSE